MSAEVADNPFEELDGEPGDAATTDQGPAGILRKRNDTPLEEFDGLSLDSLIDRWPQRLDRAVHTAADAAPGELWVDLLFGGMGWTANIVQSEGWLDLEPGSDEDEDEPEIELPEAT